MTQKDKTEEQAYFTKVESELARRLGRQDGDILAYSRQLRETQSYFNDASGEMDSAEKASMFEEINKTSALQGHMELRRAQVLKLIDSPYFGRIDFSSKQTGNVKVYIGLHAFETEAGTLIYDWRAPISALFYDSELGPAEYAAPKGKIKGVVTLKRQFRIRQGKIDFMFDSSLKIDDDVLQEELGRSSDSRMRNIVATIQREQNQIIRNLSSGVMIIQGVAGSGKTSIALHRIAYLLYQFKGRLEARDVLVISPNRVFSDYISNVLPELGEENISRIEMDELAGMILGKRKFQTFFDQVNRLAGGEGADDTDEMKVKASVGFARRLEQFVHSLMLNNFTSRDIEIYGERIPARWLQAAYDGSYKLPLRRRISEMVTDALRESGIRFQGARTLVQNMIRTMFVATEPFLAYRLFFHEIGREDLAPTSIAHMDYEDVFPFIYVLMHFEDVKPAFTVKHLVVDEMQDYSPVQYMVLKKLFGCDMTILGDSLQAVNPHTSSTMDDIRAVFPSAITLELNRSYRSSFEIMALAQRILRNDKLKPMKRHGEVPEIVRCPPKGNAVLIVLDRIEAFKKGLFRSMGIVCKTQDEAEHFYESIRDSCPEAKRIDPSSKEYSPGIAVVSAHMAKGLEFDYVVVPDASSSNYANETDRHLLYVSVTRAMHRLTLIYKGSPSPFLKR